jgi:hypothetical protein
MSIEDIKSTISKKGGVARTNRFQVVFTPPQASLLNTDPSVLLGTLTSGGSAGNLINDPRDVNLLCESVTLPGRNISTLDYQTNTVLKKMPYTFIDSEVSMTFILTNDYYARNMFEAWYESIFNVENYRVGYKNDYTTDVNIIQLNTKGLPAYGVTLIKAFPISIGNIELSNATENEYARLQVIFAYDRYTDDLGDVASSTVGSIADQIFG